MKANERKIAFICFQKLFRIGTFQWITADSNKKIPSAISGCARRSEVNFGDVRLLLVGSLSTAGFDPATANGIARISLFAKDMRWFSVDLPASAAAIRDPSSGRCRRSASDARFRGKVAGAPDIGREQGLVQSAHGVQPTRDDGSIPPADGPASPIPPKRQKA
jgi:hypothetical protein